MLKILIVLVGLAPISLLAQDLNTQNLFIVTMDGFRWQELFQGADSVLLFNKGFVNNKSVNEKFWNPNLEIRREKLMPFFWNTIGKEGQLYGNRKYNNRIDCSNSLLFSSPGYSEMYQLTFMEWTLTLIRRVLR